MTESPLPAAPQTSQNLKKMRSGKDACNVKKPVDLIPCKFCPRRFRKAVRFLEHIEWVHGYKKGCELMLDLGGGDDKNIPCHTCGVVFTNATNLIEHELALHLNNKILKRKRGRSIDELSSPSMTPSPLSLSDHNDHIKMSNTVLDACAGMDSTHDMELVSLDSNGDMVVMKHEVEGQPPPEPQPAVIHETTAAQQTLVSEGLVPVITETLPPQTHPLTYCSTADLPRVFEVALLLTQDHELRSKLIECGIQLGLDMSQAINSFSSPPNVIVLPQEGQDVPNFAHNINKMFQFTPIHFLNQ